MIGAAFPVAILIHAHKDLEITFEGPLRIFLAGLSGDVRTQAVEKLIARKTHKAAPAEKPIPRRGRLRPRDEVVVENPRRRRVRKMRVEGQDGLGEGGQFKFVQCLQSRPQ